MLPSVPLIRRMLAAGLVCLFVSMPAALAQKDPAPPADDGKPGESAPAPDPAPAPEPAPAPQPSPEPAPAPAPAPETEPAPAPADVPFGGSPLQIAGATMAWSETQLPPDFDPGPETFLGDPANERPSLTLGNVALMQRQLIPAAWYFASAVARDPVDPVALNNLGVVLAELDAIDFESGAPGPLLPSALALFDAARGIDPSRAAFHANFGETAYLMDRQGEGGPGLAAARQALETAVGLDDALMLHRLHLAEVLAAQGDTAAAAEILSAIHRELAFHPTYLVGMQRAGLGGGATAWPQPDRSYCAVNFDCLNTCPPGIIGRVQVINCEIAQQDALLACQAGQPFASTYDCSEELPQFGIAIPGLNSGFSVRTPWGGFDVIHQGDRIDFQFQAGPNLPGGFSPQVSGQGSWDPRNGLSVSQFQGDIRYNFLHRNEVGAMAGRYDFPPVFAEGHVGGDTTLDAGIYNASLWSY